MALKLSNLKLVLGYWNENMNQNFRFNNPKQYSNWIILVSFCSSHLAIKNCYNVHLWQFKKSIFSQKNSKKFVYYNEELVTNSKRNYLENYNDSELAVKTKNAPFFMIFPNISFFHMVVNYWTGPLSLSPFNHFNDNLFTFLSKLRWV